MDRLAGEIIVFVTASSEEEAARIARHAVEARLAACGNILTPIRSIYRWEEEVQDEQEVLLILKTRSDLFEPLASAVKGLHSYQVPEIIAVSLAHGSPDYLQWIRGATLRS